ncbi:MAG: hypothetical protein H6922_05270 [Pseudomonadaceae bacterium]|nr:hypothetical protein [Pseudomonadaceae bacterium]
MKGWLVGVAGVTALVPAALADGRWWKPVHVDPHRYFYCDAKDRALRTRLSRDMRGFVRVEHATVGCLGDFPLVLHGVKKHDGRVQWCLGVVSAHPRITWENAHLERMEQYTVVTDTKVGTGVDYALDLEPDKTGNCALVF